MTIGRTKAAQVSMLRSFFFFFSRRSNVPIPIHYRYNGIMDLHDDYYRHRTKHWPATAQRDPKKSYQKGASIYGTDLSLGYFCVDVRHFFAAWATPMETVTRAKL